MSRQDLDIWECLCERRGIRLRVVSAWADRDDARLMRSWRTLRGSHRTDTLWMLENGEPVGLYFGVEPGPGWQPSGGRNP
jgi:hypothetical protein